MVVLAVLVVAVNVRVPVKILAADRAVENARVVLAAVLLNAKFIVPHAVVLVKMTVLVALERARVDVKIVVPVGVRVVLVVLMLVQVALVAVLGAPVDVPVLVKMAAKDVVLDVAVDAILPVVLMVVLLFAREIVVLLVLLARILI